MSELIFWGEKGEYGPFTVQEDGWPNAGEVIRHYRKNLGISAEELAKRYGEAIGEQVTARWILKMEQQNKVPTDITRRRALIKILSIPPMLLGLASLEQVTHDLTNAKAPLQASTALKPLSAIDIERYTQHARVCWLLSYAGEESLETIVPNIQELEKIELQSSGNLQRQLRTVLNSYYQLTSDIIRHQGDFAVAWKYANRAVIVTRHIGINDFTAAALYRRGYISLEWGIFGDRVLQGVMNHEPDHKKIEAAVADFEETLLYARQELRGATWLELSRAQGILQNTTLTLRLSSQAEDMIGAGNSASDPLEQILLAGALNGLSEGMYMLGKAASLVVLGRTTTAIEVLDDLDELKNGKGIARNQTRRLAYADALRAEASLGTKDYISAAIRANNALQTFQDIHTVERIAWINSIYNRLVDKHINHPEVKALGKKLEDYYASRKNNFQKKR